MSLPYVELLLHTHTKFEMLHLFDKKIIGWQKHKRISKFFEEYWVRLSSEGFFFFLLIFENLVRDFQSVSNGRHHLPPA